MLKKNRRIIQSLRHNLHSWVDLQIEEFYLRYPQKYVFPFHFKISRGSRKAVGHSTRHPKVGGLSRVGGKGREDANFIIRTKCC
jgi:hypothetical protein